MKENEVFDILFDFADGFGADKITEVEDKYNYVVEGKLNNGEILYLYTNKELDENSYITVNVGKSRGLGLCSVFPKDDVKYIINQFVSNYCAYKRYLSQSDLEMIGHIDIAKIQGAVDVWL